MSLAPIVDSVDLIYNNLISGLVVSGSDHISVRKAITSGDALTSLRVSGATDLIILKLSPGTGIPLTGGVYTEMTDHVKAEIYRHRTYLGGDTSTANSGLKQLVSDFKSTILSGTWSSGIPIPYLVSERWGQPQEKVAKAELIYRCKYLL